MKEQATTQDRPVLLITGANTGLGFETVKAVLQSDVAYNLIIASLKLEWAEEAVRKAQSDFPNTQSILEAIQIDLENDESIQKAFDRVSSKHGKLDALVNNAGAQFDYAYTVGNIKMRDAWIRSWNVNTVGTQIVTYTFVPLLLKSQTPRVVFLTSGTSTLAETSIQEYDFNFVPEKGWPKQNMGFPAYRASKTGLNMMMREWDRLLRNDGVKFFCVDPGFSATNLGGDPETMRKLGAQDRKIGGNFVKDVVEGKRDHDVAKVVRIDGIQPW